MPCKEELPCWNCLELGHTHRECKLPQQHVFCYLCGATNADKDTCVNRQCVETRKNDIITGRLIIKPHRRSGIAPPTISPPTVITEEAPELEVETDDETDSSDTRVEEQKEDAESDYNIEDAFHLFD